MHPNQHQPHPFPQKTIIPRYEQHSSLPHNNPSTNPRNHTGIKTSLTMNRNSNFHLVHNFQPHGGQYHTLEHAHSHSCSHGGNQRESAGLGDGTPIFIRKNISLFENKNANNQIGIPNMLYDDKTKKNTSHQQPKYQQKITSIIEASNTDPNIYIPPTPTQSTNKQRSDSPFKHLFIPSITSPIPTGTPQTVQPFPSPPSPTRTKPNLFSNSIYLDYNATMPLNKPTNSALFQSPNLLRLVKNKTATSNIVSNNSEFSDGNRGRKRCSHSETKRNKYITVVSRMPVKKNIILQLHS